MSNNEELKEFLNHLLSNAVSEHKNSKEYNYIKEKQNQIDELLSTYLTYDQKVVVEEMIFELGLSAERETEVVYRQGIKDCIWILKSIGVLS